VNKLAAAITLFCFLLATTALSAGPPQSVRVNPDGVNVNANNATVVFLTFGPLTTQVPAEGCWCGELIPATPDLGFKCNPATVFGCLPARLDLSARSGSGGFTDIMSIPPSVARRAYQAAEQGAQSSFFYVRRFINRAGGPDEYVPVTCRMAGGGARTPFALTDVKLSFAIDKPILLVKPGEKLPPLKAEITYNGTGRLAGRWEVVMPGEEPPAVKDLLTEATLPVEERGRQRRYTQLSRFNIFLPPTGKYTLPGPEVSRLPSTVEGQYLILLRVEATDDKEADSNLAVVGAGPGVVHSGAVAGFPLPPLRYFVGSGGVDRQLTGKLALLLPAENDTWSTERPADFSWTEIEQGAFYRLEVEDAQAGPVFSALLPRGVATYRTPSWLKERTRGENLRWRVVALDQAGTIIGETAWRNLRLTSTGQSKTR
jgi:hypothetical protein